MFAVSMLLFKCNKNVFVVVVADYVAGIVAADVAVASVVVKGHCRFTKSPNKM